VNGKFTESAEETEIFKPGKFNSSELSEYRRFVYQNTQGLDAAVTALAVNCYS